MLLIKRKEITKDKITYYYQPECKGKEGIITYFREKEYKENDPDYEIEIIAENDFGEDYESSPYRAHTIYALRDFHRKGDFPEEKFIAWG